MAERLIRRDVKLPKGTKLTVRTIVEYDIELDDDFLEGDDGMTLQEVEDAIGGKHATYLFSNLRSDYAPNDVEHEWRPTATDPSEEIRFELPWERDVRTGKRSSVMLRPPEYVEFTELAELV